MGNIKTICPGYYVLSPVIDALVIAKDAIGHITALKISPDGNTIWQQIIPISDNEIGVRNVEAHDGGFLISRYVMLRNPDPNTEVIYPTSYLKLSKLSQIGSFEWEIDVSDSIGLHPFDMKISADESIVLLGSDCSSDSTEGLYVIYKVDKDGNFLSSKFCEPIVRNLKLRGSEIEIPYYPNLYGISPCQNGKWLICGSLQISDTVVMPSALEGTDLKWYISILDENFNSVDYFYGEKNFVAPLSITQISPDHAVISCVGGETEVPGSRGRSETRLGEFLVLLHYVDK